MKAESTPRTPANSEVLADMAAALSGPRTVGTTPFVVVPEGYRVEDLSRFLDRPQRRSGSATFYSMASFVAYVNAFKSSASRIFASAGGSFVKAILDYHEAGETGEADWGDHVALLQLKQSDEWNTWTGQNKKSMNQEQFGHFLEDNLPDIAVPDGAVVLEAAKNLSMTKTVVFKRGVNLDNGTVQLTYLEDVAQGSASGQLTIPTELILGLPVYEHGTLYKVRARLRYSITNDKIAFTYVLDRPHKIIEAAFNETLEAIQEATDIEPWLGTAA